MIVCINSYEIPPQQTEAFEHAFRGVLDLLKLKPGFIGVRLLRTNDDSGKFVTYAEWESLDHQREAGKDPSLIPRMKEVLAIARPKAEWFETVFEERNRLASS